MAVLSTALMKEEDQAILPWRNTTENSVLREKDCISQVIIKINPNNMVSTTPSCLIFCKANVNAVSTVLLSTFIRKKRADTQVKVVCYSTKIQNKNVIEAC